MLFCAVVEHGCLIKESNNDQGNIELKKKEVTGL
jgi:hypothetical protein